MKDTPGTRMGPQLYLLSEDSYLELKEIQTMVHLMARIARGDAGDAHGTTTVTISRAELYRVFIQISEQIGEALDQLRNENWFADQQRAWQ
ncbi:hypothetical protein DWU98_02760 [Dyella monticola]|uniref:XAC0095-like domain-containing protein n=1 Tax=Dyella monticola TaxID=1927958 RepID=A0A370X8Z2_9GAMM|nr:hypothetical protein [Dyella monticola]RDS84893.1 hypothetical protein DWU98_02760 [Dyella monticola]